MIPSLPRPVRLPGSFLPSRLSSSARSSLLRPTRLHYSFKNAPPTSVTGVTPQKSVQASAFAQRGRVPNKYPERLLIFHSPTPVTAVTGLGKAMTVVFFGVGGCMIAAPNAYYNPEMPLWMTPAVVVFAAVPMLLVSFMTAPFVAEVFIRLPEWARKSKDTLHKFVRQLPPDTRLEIQKMGFLPLPRTRHVQLSELRSKSSALYLANLEHVPHANSGSELPGWLRFTKNYLYTRPSPTHWEKTTAPEVWPLVLDHVSRNSMAAGSAKPLAPFATKKSGASLPSERELPGPATAMPRTRKTVATVVGRK